MGGTPEGVSAIEAEIAAEEERELKVLLEKRVKFAGEVYGVASGYDNAIVVAGYAAFFALWSGVSKDVGTVTRSLAAAMMGLSLILYIAWHLHVMLSRNRYDTKVGELLRSDASARSILHQWDKIDAQRQAASLRTRSLWPWIFQPAVVLGAIGALVLVLGCLANALGLTKL